MKSISAFPSVRSGLSAKSNMGQVQLLAAITFLILLPTSIIIAQNATNMTHVPIEGLFLNDTGFANASGVLNKTLNATYPENQTLEHSPSENQILEPAPPEQQTLENSPSENQTNGTVNATAEPDQPDSNGTTNSTTEPTTGSNETETQEPVSEDNKTSPLENQTDLEPAPPEQQILNETEHKGDPLRVELVIPEKVTRKGSFVVSSVVFCLSDARNVTGQWVIPEGFALEAGSLSVSCNDMAAGEECNSNIQISTGTSTPTGLSEIKFLVSYAE